MQFSGKSVQKRVNSVQTSNKPDILMGQSKKLTDSQSSASLRCRNTWIRWKFASETTAGVFNRFSFATATTIQRLKNSSNNENTVKKALLSGIGLEKWCLEKGIAKDAKILVSLRSYLIVIITCLNFVLSLVITTLKFSRTTENFTLLLGILGTRFQDIFSSVCSLTESFQRRILSYQFLSHFRNRGGARASQ